MVNYARGLRWGFVFNILTKFIALVAGLIIARLLGPQAMSSYWVILSIFTFADLFREAGLLTAFLNDRHLTPARERAYNLIGVFSGILIGAVIAALCVPISRFFQAPELLLGSVLTGVLLAINGLGTIPTAKLFQQGRFKEAGFIESLAFFLSYAIALGLIAAGMRFEALVIQLILCSFITFSCSAYLTRIGSRHIDRQAVRPILREGLIIMSGNFLWLTYSLVDQLIVARLFGAGVSGNYGAAKQLTAKPGDFLGVPLMRTIQVAVGHRAGEHDRIQRALGKALIAFCMVIVPMFVCLSILAKPFVVALLSSRYETAVPIVPALAFCSMIKIFGGLPGNVVVALGRSKVIALWWLVGYAMAAVYLYVRWSALDAVEIAWAFGAGMALVNGLILMTAMRIVGLYKGVPGNLLKSLLATIIVGGAAWGLLQIPLGPWVTVVLGLVGLTLLFVMLVGTIFAAKPLYFFSKTRTREFWEAL